MKRKLYILQATALGGVLQSFLNVGHIYAATLENCSKKSSTFLGLPTWYKYLSPTVTNDSCELTFKFPDDIGKITLAVTEILLRFGGLIAVIFVMYGGFRYIISQGEPENTKNARKTIINAIIGLIISIIATIVISFIGREFTKNA